MGKAFHKPYLITTVCAVALLFLNIIAFAQGTPPTLSEPVTLEYIARLLGYTALFGASITFIAGYIWNLRKKWNIEQEKENSENWKELAESRHEKVLELKNENTELKTTEKRLRAQLLQQKKLTLRLIAKIEGEGDEFSEETEDL